MAFDRSKIEAGGVGGACNQRPKKCNIVTCPKEGTRTAEHFNRTLLGILRILRKPCKSSGKNVS